MQVSNPATPNLKGEYMKIPSPFKLYKFLRGYEVKFHIGLPRRLCIWIAREYMFSRFWKIRWENIEKGLKESDHE